MNQRFLNGLMVLRWRNKKLSALIKATWQYLRTRHSSSFLLLVEDDHLWFVDPWSSSSPIFEDKDFLSVENKVLSLLVEIYRVFSQVQANKKRKTKVFKNSSIKSSKADQKHDSQESVDKFSSTSPLKLKKF